MDRSVHLWLSILELSKILIMSMISKTKYDYVWLCKTKIRWKSKIVLYGYRKFHCIHKTDDIFKDIWEGVETRFDISNYELDTFKFKSNWHNER